MGLPEGTYSLSKMEQDDVEVGKYTAIADDCYFHGRDNHISSLSHQMVANNLNPDTYSKGKIKIGNDVWVGRGVRILSGSEIADGCIVGAGAVISGYIKPYAIVVGNPAVIKKFRFTDEQIIKLLAIKWWNWGSDLIQERYRAGEFEDIDKFIQKYD